MFILKQLTRAFSLTLLLLQPGLPHAHAVITDTSLNIEPIAPHQETQIKLAFNSNIELALSQIFLVSEGDQQQLVHAVKGRSPGQVIVDIPALQPGEYALRFTVFAADGHLTEDVLRFTVSQ